MLKGRLLGKKLSVLLLIVVMVTSVIFFNFSLSAAGGFSNFISRSGDKLFDGDKEYRFISVNVPEMRSDNAFEQEDAILSVKQMGGQVIRVYPFSVKVKDDDGFNYFIQSATGDAAKDYNEKEFRSFDKMLELCNKHGIRVIVPFVDQWDYYGGVTEYARLVNRNFNSYDFFNKDSIVRDAFKKFVYYVLNRTNYYTGVKYKDDKAIMAWETGNELQGDSNGGSYHPDIDHWTEDIAKYMKENDKKHIVIDGKYARWGITEASLKNPYTDAISNHYYPNDNNSQNGNTYAERCKKDRQQIKGIKPYMIGEFGFTNYKSYEELFHEVMRKPTSSADTNCAGALLWSLKPHSENGGYGFRNETNFGYYAYHWPGENDVTSYPDNEPEVMQVLRNHAFEIQGLAVPPMEIPEKPNLFDIFTPSCINWQGSVGASSYNLERATASNGPWSVIGNNIYDEKAPTLENPLFKDSTAEVGKTYYYRLSAKNKSGVSAPSNVVGPVKVYGANELGENLALRKPAYSSSSETNSSNTSDKAFDGNKSTRWSSAYKDGESLWVDLGKISSINRVILTWENSYARAYKVQISANGSDWKTVFDRTEGTGWINNILFNTVEARFVKVITVSRALRWGASLWEFEVYAASGDLATPTPDATVANTPIVTPVETPITTPQATPVITPNNPAEIMVEAESGTRTSTDISTARAGYSGAGYVSGFDGAEDSVDSVEVTITVASAGTYNLVVGYCAEFGDKFNSVYVNNSDIGQKFSKTSSFQTADFGYINLRAGENKIKVQKDANDWGWIEVDYFLVKK